MPAAQVSSPSDVWARHCPWAHSFCPWVQVLSSGPLAWRRPRVVDERCWQGRLVIYVCAESVMAKDGSRAAPKHIRKPLVAQGMDSPVQSKPSVTRLWVRRLLVRVDGLSMPSGLVLGVGFAGVCGYGFLRAGPQWGLGGAVLLLGMACTLALTGDTVADPLPEPDQESIPTPAPQPATTAFAGPAKSKAVSEPLEMIELPGGEFWMGSPESEPERYRNEIRHRVRVSAFAMAKVPVTQKLYEEVMEQSPSYFKGEPLPVDTVSWFDAVKFCNRLSERVGLQPCYRFVEPKQGKDKSTDREAAQAEAQPEVEWDQSANGYRLPTEAEWECACRAGSETAYSFGDEPAQLGEYAWFDGNSEMRTHEVGTKKPNGWGLCDLHGNVWEWCWDWYGDYQVTNDNSVRLVCPVGPPSGVGRVLRGGSFVDGPRSLRSAFRYRLVPVVRYRFLGFRCVRGSERQR